MNRCSLRARIMLYVIVSLLFSCSDGSRTGPGDVVSKRAMVASAHPLASEVGLQILKSGGNAVDAALAMAFALSIAEPNASGIGGGGFMLFKMADAEEAIMVDYREMAPLTATSQRYYSTGDSFGALSRQGSLSVGVPGLAACAGLLLEQYGTKTIEEILRPSIELCREGVVVSEKLRGMIVDNLEKIISYPATAEIYLRDMLPLERTYK